MPQQRKTASSGARKATRGTAEKATSTAKKATSAASKPTASAAKKTTSTARKAASNAPRASKSPASAATQSPKEIGDLTKPELVERLTAQLNKLKKDDLVGIAERMEAGSLDLSRLALSGEGGFGFQEHARDDDGGGSGGDDQRGNEGLIPRAGDALRGAAEKIAEKI